MKSRVFVSCGQATADERRIGRDICQLLAKVEFASYLAIDVQTILDINSGIIRELKNCDCYLFVNFRRERIGGSLFKSQYRGSLFSNQELAIAYSLGFEKLLIINQEGIRPEGMLRYIGNNAETFHDHTDCLNVIERALDWAGWSNSYSRRLRADNLRFSSSRLTYDVLQGWFLYLDIHNDRPDIAALEATARLSEYAQKGQRFTASNIRSPLKATGRPGFAHTIFPQSHEAFDLMVISPDGFVSFQAPSVSGFTHPASAVISGPAGSGIKVYLNSALDVTPKPELPVGHGEWTFRYEFLAIDFPVLTADIQVDIPDTFSTQEAPSARLLSQETR